MKLRIKPLCSSHEEFLSRKKRGYNRSLIEQQIDKADLRETEQLLKDEKKVSIEHSLK